MIDLSIDLPDTIEVDGKSYLIKTDFREWLKFAKLVEDKGTTLADLIYLFVDDFPQTDFSKELVEFFVNENPLPNYTGASSEPILDYLIDSEYIYASFMAVYKIDLICADLHWWQFKALLIGLPDDSKIKEIMGMRSYKKSDKKPEKVAEENKRAWSLSRVKKKENEKEILKEVNELFYGA